MRNRHTSPRVPLSSLLKWQFSKYFTPAADASVQDPVPVHETKIPPEEGSVLWLGHASVWIRLQELDILIDPVFGDIPLYRRHTPLPIPQEQIHADLILITHAHYDHFDKPSVSALLKRNPEATVVAPAGFWRYLRGMVPRERCFELEWWESLMFKGVFITFVPSRHWSKRGLNDTNKALWGGYVVQQGERSIYHAGDTAYGEHFKEIAGRFSIHEAFLPIGAYRPEYIMRHNHLNPPEAFRACGELEAETFIPVHYGTFRLSDESLREPIEWFERLRAQTEHPFECVPLEIGEIYRLSTTSTDRST